MSNDGVPIYNLYCLLSYVWNTKLDHQRNALATAAKTPLELLVRLLTHEVRRIRLRGLERGYITKMERMPRVTGKIHFGETLKSMGLKTMTPTCEYSEYQIDVLTNQILKAALIRVHAISSLNTDLKEEVVQLLPYFAAVTPIAAKGNHVSKVQWQRNNLHYRFALLLAGLILDHTIPTNQVAEDTGAFEFVDFTRDERQLGNLFEAFVLAYWTREHRDSFDRLTKRKINWVTDDAAAETSVMLPNQEVDLELVSNHKKALIEVKFTKKPLVTRYAVEKLRTDHLRQLYTYLDIYRHKGERVAFGTLLYAQVGTPLKHQFRLNGLAVKVSTVDLGAPWSEVKTSMDIFITETIAALHQTSGGNQRGLTVVL